MINKGPFNDLAEQDYWKLIYFDVHVLEKYFANTKYSINYSGYRGSIALKDEYAKENEDYEYIKNFGLASCKNDSNKRYIVCFAEELSKLPFKIQAYWYHFLIEEDKTLYPNSGFVTNLIQGEWVKEISTFEAVLMEMHFINIMCENMQIPKMFKQEYDYQSSNFEALPTRYHIVLCPTRDNYYNFINTFEKLIVNNIEKNTFLTDAPSIKKEKVEGDNRQNKGTLVLLEEWLNKNTIGVNSDEIVKPLKHLRKIRQKPAHELYENDYDEKIWSDQKTLVEETYLALRTLRQLFANHPNNDKIEINKELYNGDIVWY